MKRVGKLCLCLAGGLVLNTGLRAEGLVSRDNPYGPIVTRNVFGIHPPPPVDPKADTEPPPKITPNGIMSTFGHLQVLFKVAVPAKPGQPAKDQSYILSEGQAQDDIEVTKIDDQAGVVTFKNHGTVQELPLIVGTASGPPSTPAPGGPGPGPGPKFPMPGMAPGGGNANNGAPIFFGNRFGQSGGLGRQNPNMNANFGGASGGASGGANFGSSFGATTTSGGLSSQLGATTTTSGGFSGQLGASTTSGGNSGTPPLNNLTPDEIQALVAANHLAALQSGNPSGPIFPPTRYDREAGIPAPPPPPAP